MKNEISRPVVLIFADHYLPGFKFGGPVQSIANIVENFSANFEFRIVTRDRDYGDTERFPGVTPGKWMRMGSGHALYLDIADQTLRSIAKVMRDTAHDAVYLNSFFSPRFTILPLIAQRLGIAPPRPVILSPRGEFSAGALELKRNRKRAYILASKALRLYDHAIWKASTDYEANDIRAVFGAETRIVIASDIPHSSKDTAQIIQRKSGEPLRVLFLSRITPMKNLTFALKILTKVNVPVDFTIIGPVSDQAYWAECENLMKKVPPHINVNYLGAIEPHNVGNFMAQNDLFFLPTLGENFGHVIFEALAVGTPVLISDRTPWRDLETSGCGWVGPLENSAFFTDCIEKLYNNEPKKLNEIRQCAIYYTKNYKKEDKMRKKYIDLFNNSIST
jgi:glycosyltransferase involved in cell wall biosynthesis